MKKLKNIKSKAQENFNLQQLHKFYIIKMGKQKTNKKVRKEMNKRNSKEVG